MKRYLICGDRNWNNVAVMDIYLGAYIDKSFDKIIEGGCKGADVMARNWAIKNGVGYEEYPADWSQFGSAAGPIRNKKMLSEGKPDFVIAFHNNIQQSSGTKNMINQSLKFGVPVFLVSSDRRLVQITQIIK